MPIVQIHQPIFDRIPRSLYDGAFQSWICPDTVYQFTPYGFYFEDRTWGCDDRHLLGYSREIIHCLKSSDWTKRIWSGTRPNWLCGHAFEWLPESEDVRNGIIPNAQVYRKSGTDTTYTVDQMVRFAEEAIELLDGADIHLDQWGGNIHQHWLRGTDLHLKNGYNGKNWFIQAHLERHGALDTYIRLKNQCDAIWHNRYPIQGPLNASGIGQTYCNGILNAAFQATAFTGAATIYCALHSVTPSDTSQGTEAAYTGYARQSITCNSTNFPNASAGTITYGVAVNFPTNSGAGETEVAVSWQAASSGGTQPNWWGTFSSTTVGTGIAPIFAANALITSGV